MLLPVPPYAYRLTSPPTPIGSLVRNLLHRGVKVAVRQEEYTHFHIRVVAPLTFVAVMLPDTR